jgi:ribonuclease-3
MKPDLASKLQDRIAYTFQDPLLLAQALTHSSYAYESEDASDDNEVLEFLGDSVLGFILADFLCETFPDLDEGGLSKLKSIMASTSALHGFAQDIKLHKSILLGRGEEKSGGRKKKSILAGAFEAVIAAIYLDGGIDETRRFLLGHFRHFIRKIDTEDFIINNYKSALQEYLQKEDPRAPVYRTVTTRGPDHKKRFEVEVSFQNKRLASAKGSSKKDAEQKAAERAFKKRFGSRIKSLTSESFLYKKNKP